MKVVSIKALLVSRTDSRDFHREVARNLLWAGMLDLTLLRADKRVIGARCSFEYNGSHSFYASGYRTDESWSKFSLGAVMDLESIQASINAGLQREDLLRNEGEYKSLCTQAQRHPAGDALPYSRRLFEIRRLQDAEVHRTARSPTQSTRLTVTPRRHDRRGAHTVRFLRSCRCRMTYCSAVTAAELNRNPDFLKLWSAQTISYFGSMFGALGLTALVFLDASPGQMGVLAMAQGLPVLMFALVAGVYIDRLPRRPVLILADVGRFTVLLTVPVAALLDGLRMEQLYLVGFLAGALELAFNVAYRSYLPALVTRDQLLSANSRLAATESIAESGSPAIGGLVVQTAGGPIAVLLDGLTFLASGALVHAIRRPEPPRPREQRTVAAEAREGIAAVRDSPILRALTGAKGTASFFGSFIGALYGVFLINELGFSPLAMGITIGAGGIGSLFGSWLIGPLSRRIGFGPTILISSTGIWAWLIPLAGGPKELAFAMIVAAQVCGDPFWMMYEIGTVSLRQAVTPDEMLARVSSTMHLVEAGLAPIGALTAGLLAEAIGVRETLAIAAAGLSAAAIWILLSPIPKLKQPPVLDTSR